VLLFYPADCPGTADAVQKKHAHARHEGDLCVYGTRTKIGDTRSSTG
jgi:hypothetical protein